MSAAPRHRSAATARARGLWASGLLLGSGAALSATSEEVLGLGVAAVGAVTAVAYRERPRRRVRPAS